jgi:hypothetical protein
MSTAKKNKLLIGASSPVGYYYARESEERRPGPILEAPLSYMLLYDQLWFLSRKLCPYNMEQLDFVHFVDEDLCPEGLSRDALASEVPGEPFAFPWDTWKNTIAATIGLRWSYDNHARGLKFGELGLLPTPGRYENLIVDRLIASRYDMDLAENTPNAAWSRQYEQDHLQMSISERMLSARLTSLQTIDGPWHDSIADLRSDRLLKTYRNKISGIDSITNSAELDNRLQSLSDEFERETRKIVSEHFETMNICTNTLLYLISILPIIGTVGTILGGGKLVQEIIQKRRQRRERGWVGFLSSVEQKAAKVKAR